MSPPPILRLAAAQLAIAACRLDEPGDLAKPDGNGREVPPEASNVGRFGMPQPTVASA